MKAKEEITNPFYCGNNGELYYAYEDKANMIKVTRKIHQQRKHKK